MKKVLYLGIIFLFFFGCKKEYVCEDTPLSQEAEWALNGNLCTNNGEKVAVRIKIDYYEGEVVYTESFHIYGCTGVDYLCDPLDVNTLLFCDN